MKILMDLLSSKNGDELFEKVQTLLGKFGIVVCNSDGTVKDLHTLCCEVVEVLNKEK
jgi:hypothetical protein